MGADGFEKFWCNSGKAFCCSQIRHPNRLHCYSVLYHRFKIPLPPKPRGGVCHFQKWLQNFTSSPHSFFTCHNHIPCTINTAIWLYLSHISPILFHHKATLLSVRGQLLVHILSMQQLRELVVSRERLIAASKERQCYLAYPEEQKQEKNQKPETRRRERPAGHHS